MPGQLSPVFETGYGYHVLKVERVQPAEVKSRHILIAPATLQLVEGFVQVKSLGPVAVKGLRDPIEVFEVIGAGLSRSRFHAAVVHGLTRFVGRESDLQALRQTLERASAGHGQVLALVGASGNAGCLPMAARRKLCTRCGWLPPCPPPWRKLRCSASWMAATMLS